MSQCTAHRKNSGGERCRQSAIRGADVCRWHGGSNPTVQRAAKRNLLRQQAAQVLRRMGEDSVDPVRDPSTELARLAGRLQAIELILWSFLLGEEGAPNPQLVKVHGEAAEREARVLSDMKRLGLEEHAVHVEATKAQLLATALQHVLRDLDLSPEQHAKAPGLIRQHLLSLPAGNGSEVTT